MGLIDWLYRTFLPYRVSEDGEPFTECITPLLDEQDPAEAAEQLGELRHMARDRPDVLRAIDRRENG